MPHAENESAPLLNGEAPSSQFISHIVSYPIVTDSINLYKSNRYGARSLEYADSGYAHFVKPLLPYAEQPYGVVSPYLGPYVARADSLAAYGLDKVDATFPLITKDTATIKDTAMAYVLYPVHLADETKAHVFGTWGQEYKKCGGDGMVAAGKATVTTGLVLTSEALAIVGQFLSQKKAQGESAAAAVKEKVQN